MSHSNTARMLGYWEDRRGDAGVPQRSSIDPADFADVVTQAFLFGRDGPGAYPFRLAGALLEDLHRGPLVGADFMHLWSGGDRLRIQTAIEGAFVRRQSLIVTAHGRSLAGAQAKLEILLAPLADRHGKVERMLGFYQPVSPLFRLQDQHVERLFVQEMIFADGGDPLSSALRLASVDGRLIA